MLYLRRFDLVLQYLVCFLIICSFLFFLWSLMCGLPLIGVIQLLSAIANTSAFLKAGMADRICNYWKYVGAIFTLLFFYYFSQFLIDSDLTIWLIGLATVGSIPVVIYYARIYYSLITHHQLRQEVDGLTKSSR